ncbi:MAG: carboxylating nicotinate-nucleotide diphosphorylase [Thermodesulfobacteriota bacterium]
MWIKELIKLAIREDIGPGDITTDYLIPPGQEGVGVILAKQRLVLAGTDVAHQVFRTFDEELRLDWLKQDGDWVEAGETVMTGKGKLAALLKGERIALNFLQRLSGIATHVRGFVDVVADLPVRLVDTRKTTPGWRELEKYAVRVGGACNHRMGLFDGVLIKDNHIAACGGILLAVRRAREKAHHLVRIEVEVSNAFEVEEALQAGADVIMLDNMTDDQIRAATAVIAGRALVEVSGNVTRSRLRDLATAGADLISVGALTHSATAVDLSMRIQSGEAEAARRGGGIPAGKGSRKADRRGTLKKSRQT